MDELDKIVIVKEGHGYTTYINDVHLKEMMFFQAEWKMGELNNLYEFRIKNEQGVILETTFLAESIRQAIVLYYICGNTMPFTVIRRVKKWTIKDYYIFL